MLGYKSPLEVLTGNKPDYNMIKVFGCACFPFIRPFNKHKLEFRSTAAVCYNTSFKGYKVLLHTGKIIMCRHVEFDESRFPFVAGQAATCDRCNCTPAHDSTLHMTPPFVTQPSHNFVQDHVTSSSHQEKEQVQEISNDTTQDDSSPHAASDTPSPTSPLQSSPTATLQTPMRSENQHPVITREKEAFLNLKLSLPRLLLIT